MTVIWISPDWNVNKSSQLPFSAPFQNLNITRLECKYADDKNAHYTLMLGIWISPDWNVNSYIIESLSNNSYIWISPDWNVNLYSTSILFSQNITFEYHQIGM